MQVLEHPTRADARVFFMGAETRAPAGDAPIIDYVGSDGSEDRYGSVIDPRGWELEPYMRSGTGVVCWAHRYDVPVIGKTEKLTQKNNRLQFRVRFAVDEWPEFVGPIYRLVKGGYMTGVSVGFIPKESEPYSATTVPGRIAENVRYTKAELLELSVVPVPANRGALKLAIAAGRLSDRDVAVPGLRDFLDGGPALPFRVATWPSAATLAAFERASRRHQRLADAYAQPRRTGILDAVMTGHRDASVFEEILRGRK